FVWTEAQDDDAAAEVEARRLDAGHEARQTLDEPDAGGAVHAFEVELAARRRGVGDARDVLAAEARVVELGVGARRGGLGRPRRLPAAAGAVRVEAVEVRLAQQGEDAATAGAAELLRRLGVDEARRHGQLAVGAALWRRLGFEHDGGGHRAA